MPQLRTIAFGAASAILCVGELISVPAEALPSTTSPGVRAASEIVSPVEQAACWRYGWNGWGWYSYCGPPPEAFVPAYWAREPGCRDVTIRERRGSETVVRQIRRCD
jgi:hypothetical protein